jgi:hypothetical protein
MARRSGSNELAEWSWRIDLAARCSEDDNDSGSEDGYRVSVAVGVAVTFTPPVCFVWIIVADNNIQPGRQ